MDRIRISQIVGALHGECGFVKRLLFGLFLCFLNLSVVLAQHDGARDSVQQIAVGKFGKVDDVLANKKPFAGEAESAFVKIKK